MSVEVTKLPSGLTVVTDSMPHLETASLGVWVGAGSRDEQPNEHGISHLLEHMAFKGTKRRTARQIAEAIEAVGGDLNAATSFETTAYFARVLKADVPLALDVLSDILSNPTFDAKELKREQNVIVQEIGATEDAPDDLVFDHLQSTAFPDQPIGRSILGTPATVCSFKADNLRAYLARNYRAPDMVVSAAGAVEHAAMVEEVERLFDQFNGPADAGPAVRQVRRRHQARGPRARAGPHRLRARRRAAARPEPLQPAGLHQHPGRRHVVPAVPGGPREARALLHDLRVPRALYRHRHVRHLRRHRRGRRQRTDAGRRSTRSRAPPPPSPRPRSTRPRRR